MREGGGKLSKKCDQTFSTTKHRFKEMPSRSRSYCSKEVREDSNVQVCF